MKYMLLIREPLGQRAERGEAAGRQLYDRMLGFVAELQSRGMLVAAESLADMGSGAARLQVREGRRSVIDGPFTETKEMVGGFFLIDVPDRQAALDIAAECPAAQWCTVEVRAAAPCWDIGAAG